MVTFTPTTPTTVTVDALYKTAICAPQVDAEKRTLKSKDVRAKVLPIFFDQEGDEMMRPCEQTWQDGWRVQSAGHGQVQRDHDYDYVCQQNQPKPENPNLTSMVTQKRNIHVFTYMGRGLVVHVHEVKQEMISSWKDIGCAAIQKEI